MARARYKQSLLRRIRKCPSYLLRLILKFYHTRLYIPSLRTKYPDEEIRDKKIKIYLNGIGGETERLPQDASSELFKNMDELGRTLIELIGNKKNILFSYHSHKMRLKNKTQDDTPVLAAVKSAAKKLDLVFYNASDDLTQAFGDNLEKYYVRGDNGGHFNFEGIMIYGRLVGKKLEPIIRTLIQRKNQSKAFKR